MDLLLSTTTTTTTKETNNKDNYKKLFIKIQVFSCCQIISFESSTFKYYDK
jgi:hypothetical protein